MTPLNNIWREVKKIVGNADDEFIFQRVTDAVELIANKGEFDPLVGTLDICATSKVVALPNEVETILGLNMLGRPALARDELFQFHINGPGSCGHAIRFEWMDLADACTYREINCPGKLWGYCEETEDESCELWVKGYDQNSDWIRTKLADNTYRDGWKVPVTKLVQAQPADAPYFSRIVEVQKGLTVGPVRLTILNGTDEIILGLYQSFDTLPRFRKIKLSHCVDWVRIKYRRRVFQVRSRYDLLPIAPPQAVVMAVRALKYYDTPGGIAEGEACEATATRWATEQQLTSSPPVAHPLQVVEGASLIDGSDHIE